MSNIDIKCLFFFKIEISLRIFFIFFILYFLFELFLKKEILSVIVACSFNLILLSHDLNFFKIIGIVLLSLLLFFFQKELSFKYPFKLTSLKLYLEPISKFLFFGFDIIDIEKFSSVFKKYFESYDLDTFLLLDIPFYVV